MMMFDMISQSEWKCHNDIRNRIVENLVFADLPKHGACVCVCVCVCGRGGGGGGVYMIA